jgi:2'-5' RNA ligase
MRCFIAIDIPEDIKKSIGGVIEKADHKSKGIRWVPLENIHLTLKFLGEVSEKMISDIEKKLSAICDAHKIFDLRIYSIGAFPNFKYPNILWVGIDASKELKDLFEAIEESLSELGFKKEDKKFSPHLTIARIKDKKEVDLTMKALSSFKDTLFGNINVKEVLLMKSILKPTGAEYSKISTFMLADKKD